LSAWAPACPDWADPWLLDIFGVQLVASRKKSARCRSELACFFICRKLEPPWPLSGRLNDLTWPHAVRSAILRRLYGAIIGVHGSSLSYQATVGLWCVVVLCCVIFRRIPVLQCDFIVRICDYVRHIEKRTEFWIVIRALRQDSG